MNIKRVALFVIMAVAFFSIGIYSQTKFNPDALVVPGNTYSGENLGFTVTATSNGRIEGFFAIKVNGKWVPLPTESEPTYKRLDSR
jgi:hypothetical protein